MCVCVYLFNQKKDGGQTCHDLSLNTNYAIITKLNEEKLKSLTTMDSGGRIAGVVVGDKEATEDMRYKVDGVFDW